MHSVGSRALKRTRHIRNLQFFLFFGTTPRDPFYSPAEGAARSLEHQRCHCFYVTKRLIDWSVLIARHNSVDESVWLTCVQSHVASGQHIGVISLSGVVNWQSLDTTVRRLFKVHIYTTSAPVAYWSYTASYSPTSVAYWSSLIALCTTWRETILFT